ncbi:hypothetical protein W908_00010 [Candidatus Pseudothioglobus singularis PS1]|uniref:Uncharacterized protein n=1 Tax=Candidatus Pseudothioglobus singularis PS1 TaxID=1125411 RepID=A0A0M4M1J3_9GAMM|nr:hypothetical protein W908_00010 [Candidatus Pseudothioglobus singularis PS1]
MKIATIYHYYELNETYKDNFIYFLNTSLFDEIEYFFYISGSCSVELPKLKNVQYTYIENKNNDFGAVVEFSRDKRSLSFDAYIFINSSVRGPFMPSYYSFNWHEIFTSRLSSKIAMVGSSINLLPEGSLISNYFKERFSFDPPYIHVQTTAYALSSDGYCLLLKERFFDVNENLKKNDVISRYEILLSQILLNNNFSIASILPTHEEFSVSKRGVNFKGTTKNGDPLNLAAFYGRTIPPLESVFIKTNRNLVSEKELASYTFTSLVLKDLNSSLTKDGLTLFQKSLEKLHAKESFTITMEQLKLVLNNVKNNSPELAKQLRALL